MREILQELLPHYGYLVFTTATPTEALKKLEQLIENNQIPQMIIADLKVPTMEDGLFFIEQVQANPNLRDVPFILASGVQASEITQVNVDAVLIKPFSTELLLQTVRRFASN
ncbi:hypothetical protein MASR2M15_09110 [Anaerolineales bacterium]